jgi:hypothetical protein
MTSTLAQIKKKIRRITASPSPSQLSDSDIEEYCDQFYELDLPAHLKLWELRDTYTFFTSPGEDRYTFNKSQVKTLQPPLYINGTEGSYTQSQTDFYRTFDKQNVEESLGVGDGTATFTGTISNTPLIRRNVVITAIDTNGDQQVAIDDPDTNPATPGWRNGNSQAYAAFPGTINYDTGAISLTFPSSIPSSSTVFARVVPYTGAVPRAMLYHQNYMYLRPVPDKAYRVDVSYFKRPSQLLNTDGAIPDVDQWWQFIALGAAIKIFQDRQDMDSIENVAPFFKEQKSLVLNRTIQQQVNQRAPTIYSEQVALPAASYNSRW